MKKIAIVSCYFQTNYGSVIQALATQMALDKLGYENETIDISGFNSEIKKKKVRYFIKASLTSDIFLSKIGRVKSAFIKRYVRNEYTIKLKARNQKFRKFSKENFHLSLKTNSISELGVYILKHYSAVLVGSDQLWLPGNIAADYYTLNWVPAGINTIAYATSFGQSTLPRKSSAKAKIFLKRIKHISVREESGQELIKHIGGRDVPVVCDPTLLFTGNEWLTIQKEEPIIEGTYIFCYFMGNNPVHREFAKRLRIETGSKIVALMHLDEFIKYDEIYVDIKLYDIDPVDFLNLIRNASYVCTDSFHCSVFSILYERTFFAFRRYTNKTSQSTNSRLDTLFKMTGISGRIKEGNEDIRKCLGEEIDFNVVRKNLNSFRDISFEYLKRSLEDKGSTDVG